MRAYNVQCILYWGVTLHYICIIEVRSLVVACIVFRCISNIVMIANGKDTKCSWLQQHRILRRHWRAPNWNDTFKAQFMFAYSTSVTYMFQFNYVKSMYFIEPKRKEPFVFVLFCCLNWMENVYIIFFLNDSLDSFTYFASHYRGVDKVVWMHRGQIDQTGDT